MKRKIMAMSISALVLSMCIVGVGASKPETTDISFSIGRPMGSQDEYYEGLMGVISNFDYITEETKSQFDAIMNVSDLTSNEFNKLQKPYDIRTIMYVEDGQTILKYVGNYAIGTDNESEYYKEFIFDFVLTEDVDIGRGNDRTLENASEEYLKQTAETISEIEEYIQENK